MNCIICGAEYQQEHEHRPGLCEKCALAVTDFDYTSALKARASTEGDIHQQFKITAHDTEGFEKLVKNRRARESSQADEPDKAKDE